MTAKANRQQGLSTGTTTTGIIEAALTNDFETVASILDQSPEAANEQNDIGLSAAMAAAGRGHLRIVQLMGNSAQLTWGLMDDSGKTVLDYAYAHADVLEYVVERQFGTPDFEIPKPV